MPMTAVGHDEVIKMEYELGLGALEAEAPDTSLAHTTSFEIGISLSEIKWGFYNTNETGEYDSSYIEFTLHDIAGTTLPLFLEVKSGARYIFFKGPKSDGSLWSGAYTKYQPIQDGCQLEFSQTQGFTYRFSGMPVGNLTKTQKMSVHSKIPINGIGDNDAKHGNTFKDYLQEIQEKWNSMLKGKKTGTARIEFETGQSSPDLISQTPFHIEAENHDNPKKQAGDPVARVQQFAIHPGVPIATVVQSLWQERFAVKETGPGKDMNAGSILEVNFKKYDGSTNFIDVKLQKKRETDTSVIPLDVCIGDDENCKGATYRAQLTGLDFRGMLELVGQDKIIDAEEQKLAEVNVIGSDSVPCVDAEETKGGADKQDKENLSHVPSSAGLPVGNSSIFDGRGILSSFLNRYKSADFALEIELPYSYGFTPVVHGGELIDAVDGCVTCGIHYTQGVQIQFYWYTDVTCETLALVPAISTNYRITSVTHTIGLSGNTTQVKLSHKNVSDT